MTERGGANRLISRSNMLTLVWTMQTSISYIIDGEYINFGGDLYLVSSLLALVPAITLRVASAHWGSEVILAAAWVGESTLHVGTLFAYRVLATQ